MAEIFNLSHRSWGIGAAYRAVFDMVARVPYMVGEADMPLVFIEGGNPFPYAAEDRSFRDAEHYLPVFSEYQGIVVEVHPQTVETSVLYDEALEDLAPFKTAQDLPVPHDHRSGRACIFGIKMAFPQMV